MTGTHFDKDGKARMVDVSAKPETTRAATARGRVRMEAATLAAVHGGPARKAEGIAGAELAGGLAAEPTGQPTPRAPRAGL